MDQALQLQLAKRLLDYAQRKTTDLAPDVLKVPIDSYLDEEVWSDEVELLFKRLPIVACLSSELPEPGSYLAQTIVGVPLLVTRDAQGGINAFLNVCTHRGAKVAAEGGCAAKAGRFSCPYHAWTYDNLGNLIGVPDQNLFGDVDRAAFGLTRLQADERCGMVFVILTPGLAMDIDGYLGGMSEYFGTHADNLSVIGTRTVMGGHWKLVVEGHMESYHFSTLHRNSIGPIMVNNCSASDKLGAHNVITFCAKSIRSLEDVPETEWRPIDDDHIQPQYHFFPGTLVTQFKDGMIAQLIRPGSTPGESTNRLVAAGGARAEINEEKLDMVAQLVEVEDYSLSYDILKGMTTGARSEVVFGKNELSAHHFHESMDALLADA